MTELVGMCLSCCFWRKHRYRSHVTKQFLHFSSFSLFLSKGLLSCLAFNMVTLTPFPPLLWRMSFLDSLYESNAQLCLYLEPGVFMASALHCALLSGFQICIYLILWHGYIFLNVSFIHYNFVVRVEEGPQNITFNSSLARMIWTLQIPESEEWERHHEKGHESSPPRQNQITTTNYCVFTLQHGSNACPASVMLQLSQSFVLFVIVTSLLFLTC